MEMASPGRRIGLPLLGLAILSAATDSKSFGYRRTYVSVAGGGDSLASGTGALVGFGSVDFGRAGLAGEGGLPGGVDGGGDFEDAIEKVSGKRGKNGKSAERAFVLSKKGSHEGLLERGSFSLDDGQLKTRRLKDLVYRENDKGAAANQEASYAEGGERKVANDTSGFSNSYHLNESGKKSSYSDKYRHGAKFKEAGEEQKSSSSDGGRRSFDEKLQSALKKGGVKKHGAYSKAGNKGSAKEYVGKAELKKFVKKGEEAESEKGRRRHLKKGDGGDIGEMGDGEEFYDDEYYDDGDDDVDFEVKAPHSSVYTS